MKKYIILLIIILTSINSKAQSFNTNPPVQYPAPASVWEFTKFGDIGVSEYKGLANISIPLYAITKDGVNLPFSLDYYSGGIKVSEESGLVGLGWSMNLPTVVQQIKDDNDYDLSTHHQKLPPYQGNPALPNEAVFPPAYDHPWSTNTSGLQSLGGVQDIPYYQNVAQSILIDNNGYYNTGTQAMGKYQGMFQNTQIVDSEPDIFTVNLNGEELRFCREESNRAYIDVANYQLLPVKIIKGNIGYKITLIPNTAPTSTNRSAINGLIITDLGGNQYYFDKIEKTRSGGIVSSINYRLTKIITIKGKSILFSYSETSIITENDKIQSRYARRNGTTTNGYFDQAGVDILTTLHISNPGFCGNFEPQITENLCLNTITLNYDYSFLNSIITENEKIYFSYSNRLDNATMKKLDSMEIKNLFDQKIKKYDLSYDYFISLDNGTKRLKLLQVKEEGSEPYAFEYNTTQLPSRNSYSIDYWGFYNGHNNLNLKPDLTDLGYPQYTENINNNFNSNVVFAKACTLEKIIYPTKGYTSFEYELHQFDNLLEYRGGLTPIINSGGGLRIKSIANFNFDNSILNKKTYTYTGGKCINKRVLTKEVTEKTGHIVAGRIGMTLNTPCIISSFNNFVNQTINTDGDYIGYDMVTIKNEGIENIGKIEKLFSNTTNNIVNPYNLLFCEGINYYNKTNYENGKLLKETFYDSANAKVKETIKTYYNVIQGQNLYGMRVQANGVKFFNASDTNDPEPMITYGRMLATFYPIYGKTSMLSEESVTEFFNGNSKTLTTSYGYDSFNNITYSKTYEAAANLPQRNINEVITDYLYFSSLNVLNLPNSTTNKFYDTIKDRQAFTYQTNNGYPQLKKIENFPAVVNNPDANKKIHYDLYDDKNNLLQYHQENGIYTCVIWGYNKTLPIAKLENISYSSIPTATITTLQDKSNLDVDLTSENTLRTALDALRLSFPNVMITTYTHNPLIGVTTITDPKGDVASYTYDTLGRLQSVKDKNGNLLSENQYNYKP